MINVMQLQLQPETLVNITLPHGYFSRFLSVHMLPIVQSITNNQIEKR